MENYERLIIDLLPANFTPKAKYEFIKHLLEVKELHVKARNHLSASLEWFGKTSSRHKDAKITLDILMGIAEFDGPIKVKKDINIDINYDLHEGRGEDNELL